MKRETFVAIGSALVAEADGALLQELEGLVFWRKRELRQELVKAYAPGQLIEYYGKDGQTKLRGRIDHLNKFSVSVHRPDSEQGFIPEVVQIERVLERVTHLIHDGWPHRHIPDEQQDLTWKEDDHD